MKSTQIQSYTTYYTITKESGITPDSFSCFLLLLSLFNVIYRSELLDDTRYQQLSFCILHNNMNLMMVCNQDFRKDDNTNYHILSSYPENQYIHIDRLYEFYKMLLHQLLSILFRMSAH